MRFLITFLLPILLCLQIDGWIALIETDKNQTSHCFTNEYNLGAMEENETVRVKDKCAEAVCNDDRIIQVTGCAPVFVRPPCYVVKGDINKPFPKCCYEIRCNNSNKQKDNE